MDKQTWARMSEAERKTFAIRVSAEQFRAKKEQTEKIDPRLFFRLMYRFGSGSWALKVKPAKTLHARIEGCINSWVRHYSDDGSSGVVVLVFPSTGGKKALRRIHRALVAGGVVVAGVPYEPSAYDCTGQYMCNEAEMHVCKGRVFVTQSWSLDV